VRRSTRSLPGISERTGTAAMRVPAWIWSDVCSKGTAPVRSGRGASHRSSSPVIETVTGQFREGRGNSVLLPVELEGGIKEDLACHEPGEQMVRDCDYCSNVSREPCGSPASSGIRISSRPFRSISDAGLSDQNLQKRLMHHLSVNTPRIASVVPPLPTIPPAVIQTAWDAYMAT